MTDQLVWYEDPEFWEWTREFVFPPDRWESAENEIDNLTALLQIEPSAAILDLCCGPGRFSLPLASKGFRVTAVDRTPLLLDELRKRSSEQDIDLEIVQSDMRTYVQPEKFEAVLNLFTSFGYFDDPAEDRQVLENIYEALKPGGRLLMDMGSREWVIANFQAHSWQELAGSYLLEEREFIENCARLRNRWIIVREGRTKEFSFVLRMYNAAELMTLLRAVGFASVKAMSSFKGEPFDLSSQRLVVVAEK